MTLLDISRITKPRGKVYIPPSMFCLVTGFTQIIEYTMDQIAVNETKLIMFSRSDCAPC